MALESATYLIAWQLDKYYSLLIRLCKKGDKSLNRGYDVASFTAISIICLAEITLSNVWSGTVIPDVSKSATIAMAASSSPRSRHNKMISS